MTKRSGVLAVMMAGALAGCTGGGNSTNSMDNGAANASAANASAGNGAAIRRPPTPQEQFPTRELAQRGYDERLECAAQAEAGKLLAAQQVQAADLGATRDRLVLQEMSSRGTAGAAYAITSVPAIVLELTMAETREAVDRRAAAVVRERGSTALDAYSETVRDRAEECYARLSRPA